MKFLKALTILASLAALALPAYAQLEEERLGGGSDIPAGVTIRLPEGESLPPIHQMFADNPSDRPIEVVFRAEAPVGIEVDPEWEKKVIPAQGSVVNSFSVGVVPGVAPGEYPVVVQLVRSDIELEPGRITSIPAIQAVFTVEVTGEAAAVTVQSVSAHSGDPIAATIILSARDADRGWFEIDQVEGTTLQTRVAPGEFRAAVLLGEREMAAEQFTVEAEQNLNVVIEVETVSFAVAAVRPVEERGRLVVAELVASVNNESGPLPGPSRLQATVFHGESELEKVTLRELSEVPVGITEATANYRPEGGWKEGTYSFLFELVTPPFTLAHPDRPVVEVPATGFDLLAFLAGLDTREAIALAAVVLLGVVLLGRLILVLLKRRRDEEDPTMEQLPSRLTRRPRGWRRRRKSDLPPTSDPEPTWLEARLGATTAQQPRDHDDKESDYTWRAPSAPAPRSDAPAGPSQISEWRHAAYEQAEMAEALRVVQKLHDDGRLAPDWSIADAALVCWAMTSPRVRQTLGSAGMTQEAYLAAMRKLFSHGLLGGRGVPRDTPAADGSDDGD